MARGRTERSPSYSRLTGHSKLNRHSRHNRLTGHMPIVVRTIMPRRMRVLIQSSLDSVLLALSIFCYLSSPFSLSRID